MELSVNLSYARDYISFGEIKISREIYAEGEWGFELTRDGIEIPLSGDAQSYLRKVFVTCDLVIGGKAPETDLEKKLRRINTMAERSKIHTPTETFAFRAITWQEIRDQEGNVSAIFNHSTVKVGDIAPDTKECSEPSRSRLVNKLDPKRVMTYRLDRFTKHTKCIEQVIDVILGVLSASSGKSWYVLGNHNEYIVFVEEGYTMNIIREHLSPRVAEILEEDVKRIALRLAPIQKPTIGSKIVTIALLSAGESNKLSGEVLDLSNYPIYDEEDDLGNNDGTFLVLRAPEYYQFVGKHARNMSITSGVQCRIPCELLKGMIALEQPWMPAGWYTKGMTVLEAGEPQSNHCKIRYYVPEKIAVKDIVILDTTNAHNGSSIISISSQMADYAGERFRNWWLNECVQAVDNLTSNPETWSHVYNALASSNPYPLYESGPKNVMQDTIGYRVQRHEMVGSNWVYERLPGESKTKPVRISVSTDEDGNICELDQLTREIHGVEGAEERGIVRALPVRGEYTIVMGTSMLDAEPDEDGDYGIIISSATAHALSTEEHKIKVGSRIHGWRCPILPHKGVAISFKVRNIWNKTKWWRWLPSEDRAALIEAGFDIDSPSHFQMGHACWIAPKLILGMDGDFDGDRLMLTRYIVDRFEASEEIEWRPPLIIPSDNESMSPKKVPAKYSWLSPADRITLAAASQSQISDWFARRWAEIFRNPPKDLPKGEFNISFSGEQFDISDLYELKKDNFEEFSRLEEKVMAACVMIIRGQIQRKKHPVDLGGAERAIPPNGEAYPYVVDKARALESLLCANDGPFIKCDGRTIVHPRVNMMMNVIKESGDLLNEVFAAILERFETIRETVESDSYYVYQMSGDGSVLSDSKIAFNGKFQKELRTKRWNVLAASIPTDILFLLIGGDNVWVNGKLKFRNPMTKKDLPEIPFMAKIAAKLLQARMGEIEIDGKKMSAFYTQNNDGTFTIRGMNGTEWIVDGSQIRFTAIQYQRERIHEANAWIKQEIRNASKVFAETHKLELPKELSGVFEDTESWIHTVFEAAALMRLSSIDLAQPGSNAKHWNYWSFAADFVSKDTLTLLMGGQAQEFVVNGTTHHRVFSRLDSVALVRA